MTSGALFLIKSVLDLVVGDPPSKDAQLLTWLTSHQLPLALTNEILFFAALLLIPAVLALYRNLDGSDEPWVAFGGGVLAMAIPIMLVLAIVHGRLTYPVYGITLDDSATVALIVSLYYGGAHEVTLLLGVALIIIGLTMRRGTLGRPTAAFGVAAGAFQIAGAYPWLIGPLLASITQAMFAAWLVLIGLRLTRSPRTVTSPASAGTHG
jgi:hypothetical protein